MIAGPHSEAGCRSGGFRNQVISERSTSRFSSSRLFATFSSTRRAGISERVGSTAPRESTTLGPPTPSRRSRVDVRGDFRRGTTTSRLSRLPRGGQPVYIGRRTRNCARIPLESLTPVSLLWLPDSTGSRGRRLALRSCLPIPFSLLNDDPRRKRLHGTAGTSHRKPDPSRSGWAPHGPAPHPESVAAFPAARE